MTGSVSIAIRTPLWLRWTAIALRNEQVVHDGRAKLIEAKAAGREAHAFLLELEPAMVAVAGAAHALDGLYGDIRELAVPKSTLERWERNKLRRRSRILEALKLGFPVGRKGQAWVDDFEWLFDLRDAAVHHGPAWNPTVPHPLGTNVAPEYIAYSSESAKRAINILEDVLRTAFAKPRATLPELVDWTTRHRPAVDQVLAERERRAAPAE